MFLTDFGWFEAKNFQEISYITRGLVEKLENPAGYSVIGDFGRK